MLALTLAGQALAAAPAGATPPLEPSRVTWRQRIALDYFTHTPGVGPDGTIYVPNLFGKTQAIAPDGSSKWTVPVGGDGTPIQVGSDGTIYVAGAGPGAVGGTDGIFALNPNGGLRWGFTGTRDYLLAGPSLGPDGNLYAVTDTQGIGFFSLSPAGSLRFSTGRFADHGGRGQRLAFGPNRVYFGFDMFGQQPSTFFAYDFGGSKRWEVSSPADPPQPASGPNGNAVFRSFPVGAGLSLSSYTPAGSLVYSFSESPGNAETAPDVGPDNVAYTVRNLSSLYALNPNGTVKFRYTDAGIMFEPVVNDRNSVVFMGGRIAYGEPGFFRAVSTAGQPLFQVALPTEPGLDPYGQLVPVSRPVFSPDGNAAYTIVDVAGDGNRPYADLYAYLYAIDVSGGPPGPVPDPTVPAAPTGLSARAVSSRRVDLSWGDSSANESGFRIERCSGGKCRAFATVGTVGPNVRTFSDTTVPGPGTYSYRVRAFNAAGASAPSKSATVRTT